MLKSLAVVLVVVSLSAPAFAQSWLAGDGNWSTPSKWSTGSVPGTGVSASLTRANTATINSDVSTIPGAINMASVYEGMTIQIDGDGVLTTAGTGGTYSVSMQLGMRGANVGDLGSKGTIIQNGGTLNALGGTLYMGTTTTDKGGSAEYNMNGGTLNVDQLRMGPSAGNNGILFIQKAGSTVNCGAKGLDIGYDSEYRLEGGLLNLNAHGIEARRAGSFFNMTGGTVQGMSNIYATHIVQNGGLFKVGKDTALATSDTGIGIYSSASYTATAGTVEFDVAGNGVNDTFYFDSTATAAGTALDLSSAAAVVQVNFGAYVPQLGDSWDFVTGTKGTLTLSEDNVVDIAGPLYWDTSEWESDGILTVVPEPATLSLLILGGCAALIRRRRK